MLFRPWSPYSSWRICWDPCRVTASEDVLETIGLKGDNKLEMAHHSLTETLHLGRLEHILSTRRLSLAAGAPGGLGMSLRATTARWGRRRAASQDGRSVNGGGCERWRRPQEAR